MHASVQTGPLYTDLLGDPELAGILSPEADLQAMIAVEAALAEVQAELGIIPAEAGPKIAGRLAQARPDMARLRQGTARAGVPVPALVAELRAALPEELRPWLHWGATSQDILDTAAMGQFAACFEVFEARLKRLLDTLENASRAQAGQPMAGRTRTQIAAPVTLGLRIARWAQPLIALERGLAEVRQRALRVQFGGAVGVNAAVAPQGPEVAAGLATRLGLGTGPSWHTDRQGIFVAAGWLLQLSTALAKIGKDLSLLARSEIAELAAGQPGGSSTMPQKANPVQAEMLGTLGTIAMAAHTGLAAASAHVEERDGTAWTVEWALLPQLILSAGAALRHAEDLSDTLAPDPARMAGTLTAHPAVMAEAASFALARHMPREAAQAVVREALASDLPLRAALEQLAPAGIDWDVTLDPGTVVAPARQIIDQIFADR